MQFFWFWRQRYHPDIFQNLNNMGIYIQSAAQISAQKPLCWDFLSEPIIYQEKLVHSLMPDIKTYIPANEARRMDKILKRAIVSAKVAMETANISQLDAIIAGTGLGCMDNTLHFLQDMTRYNEEMLSPTFFMKSTHNTIASQLACFLHCHGYNTTYSHGENSFEAALLDTVMQFQLQKIHTALVGAYDEMPNIYFEWLEQLRLHKKENNIGFSSETSVSFILSDIQTQESWCELKDIMLIHNHICSTRNIETFLNKNKLSINQVDTFVLGMNKTEHHLYKPIYQHLENQNILIYKHLFGHSYTSSAFGILIAALCLQKQQLFAPLIYVQSPTYGKIENILVLNQTNTAYSLTLLSLCLN